MHTTHAGASVFHSCMCVFSPLNNPAMIAATVLARHMLCMSHARVILHFQCAILIHSLTHSLTQGPTQSITVLGLCA